MCPREVCKGGACLEECRGECLCKGGVQEEYVYVHR